MRAVEIDTCNMICGSDPEPKYLRGYNEVGDGVDY